MHHNNEQKKTYVPPLVLQSVGVLLERAFMVGSPVFLEGLDTTPQVVNQENFDDHETFNFKWE